MKKSLLVLDNFKAHATESVKDRLAGGNSDFVFVPGGLHQPTTTIRCFNQ